MKSGKILLGVLAGIVTGATLGILFAPHKGTKTRKKITKKSEDYADELLVKFDDFCNLFTVEFEKIKLEANDLVSKKPIKYNEIKKEIEHMIS